MAQSLEMSFSPGRCVRYSKRFIRLCNQVNDAQQLIADVQNAINDVQQKESTFDASEDNVNYAYDTTQLRDNNLDNKVRDTAEDCKKTDRNNLQSQVFSMVFPRTVTSIINSNDQVQITEVLKIIDRIRNLGPDHPLQKSAAELQLLVDESKEAFKSLDEAKGIRNSSKADLDAAKFKLVQTYNNTILKSIQLFGRKTTDKLFPNIYPKKGSTIGEESDQTEDTIAAT